MLSRGLSRDFQHHSSKASIPWCSASLWFNSHIPTWLLEKPQLWLYTPLSAKWCLCFLICCLGLSAFFPRRKCLLISWLQSLATVILEIKKLKSVTAPTFSPSICHEVIGLDAMILVFWMLSFKPAFSLYSFTLTKKLFSFCSISVIRAVSSAYLRLLILLPAILIPACDSSTSVFCKMYSAYTLNKPSDNVQPWCIPFPTLNPPLFHVRFQLLFLDSHIGFSGDR